jgi:hypothetical protein
MTSLSDYVSMIKLQDTVLEVIVNTNMLPVIAAYGPMPEMVTIAEQVWAEATSSMQNQHPQLEQSPPFFVSSIFLLKSTCSHVNSFPQCQRGVSFATIEHTDCGGHAEAMVPGARSHWPAVPVGEVTHRRFPT